jgi:hypothetical protein
MTAPKAEPRVKITGLVCPKCKQPTGEITHQTNHAIVFKCGTCDHEWFADTRDDRRIH